MTETVPRSPDAERAFLGAMLIDPELIPQAVVRPDQFHEFGRRNIWTAVLSLHRDSRAIDIVTIQAELDRTKSVVKPSELADLIRFTPTSLNWKEYEREIIEADYRRKILGKSSELAVLALTGNGIAGDVARVVSEITEATPITGKGLRKLGDTMGEVIEQIEDRAKNPTDVWGIPTGFLDYDLITGGWQKRQLAIVAGEAGIGKTRFVSQGAIHATSPEQGHTGAVFSAEMATEEIDLRAISTEGGINLRNLETGKLRDDDWSNFYNAISNLNDHNLYIDDSPFVTPDQIDAGIARLIGQGVSLDFVVVDYIYLVAQSVLMGNKGMTEITATEFVTARLKQTSKLFNVAVIAISSVVKTGMGRSDVKLSDLRGSGQQSHDGDVVLFITKGTTSGTLNCQFMKGRHLKGLFSFDLVNDTETPRLLNATTKKIDLDSDWIR